jgi:hypothetical protein
MSWRRGVPFVLLCVLVGAFCGYVADGLSATMGLH